MILKKISNEVFNEAVPASDSCAGCALHKDALATEVRRAKTQSMFPPQAVHWGGAASVREKGVSFPFLQGTVHLLSCVCKPVPA